MLFVEVVEQLYERVELPSFSATAWAEIETDTDIPRVEIRDAVIDSGGVAGALWAWIVTTSQALG